MLVIYDFLYHIAHCAGHQGMHCSAGTQADSVKLIPGRIKPPILSHFLCLAWVISIIGFSPTQLVSFSLNLKQYQSA
jgi:hypothetical protein